MSLWRGGLWGSQRFAGGGPWRGGLWASQRAGGGGTDWSSVAIGDEVEGGIYAGKITYGDGREFHIVAGKETAEATGLQWHTTTIADPGAGSEDDGVANNDAVVAHGGSFPAFEHCSNYQVDGFSDWYLPAKNEADLLLQNLQDHTEFSENKTSGERTWSSTCPQDNYGTIYRFSDANISLAFMSNTYRVRPIRRVPVAA